jgi:hypothetical protein
MKIALVVLIALHGLIHLLGFAKAFGLGSASQLKHDITKIDGVLWFTSTALLILTAYLLLMNIEWWWIVSVIAIVSSQTLIVTYWLDARFGTIANVIIMLITVVGYGTWDFKGQYKDEVSGFLESTYRTPSSLLTEEDLKPVPVPVQNYIRYSGAIGQPKVKNFKVVFKGQIRKNAQSDWMPFTSEQYNFMEAPTRLFFMKAKMKGLPVTGYHSFKNGMATMDIRLLSLFNVQYQSGREMSIAETVTFFNDMCCMAPATLIDKRIQWLETDSLMVRAKFTANNITITAWL